MEPKRSWDPPRSSSHASKSLVDKEIGYPLDVGGGHLREIYQLTTLDPRFEVAFRQDGLHVITVEGTIDDIWGQYLDRRAAPMKSTSGRSWPWTRPCCPVRTFEVGDGFNPGLVVSPPMTAEVEVRLQHVPHSDASQLEDRTDPRPNEPLWVFPTCGQQRGIRPTGRVPGRYDGARARMRKGNCGWVHGPGAGW